MAASIKTYFLNKLGSCRKFALLKPWPPVMCIIGKNNSRGFWLLAERLLLTPEVHGIFCTGLTLIYY